MAKTFIGIDLDGNRLRIVTLGEKGGAPRPVALIQRTLDPADNAAAVIAGILAEWDATSARLAMALPSRGLLTRKLAFPFGDRRKIAAAVPLELGSRLPVDLDGYRVTSLAPVRRDDRYHTFGIAVPTGLLADTLAPFDDSQLPLRHLAVAPFALAGRLAGQPDNCLLLHVRSDAFSLLLLAGNAPVACRTSIRQSGLSPEELSARIARDAMALQKSAGLENLPTLMFGGGLDETLLRAIREQIPYAAVPEETFEGDPVPAEFLPALAMARIAADPGRTGNLRQGEFAYRGSLAPFRRQLIAAATLLTIGLAALGGGAWLSYAGKATVAAQLQRQMEQVYTSTFPGAGKPPKDILLHMTSRLNGIRGQSRQFGGPGTTPLDLLETVSGAFPDDRETVIRELSYDREGVRLAGRAASFEAVDRLAERLNSAAAFSAARIGDAKTSLDGRRVEFRIDLDFAGTGGQP